MIAIIAATWDEISLLKTEIKVPEDGTSGGIEYIIGDLYGQPVIVAETGVGIRRARTGASLIIQKFK